MKAKKMALALGLVFAMLLTGCGEKKETETDTPKVTPSASTESAVTTDAPKTEETVTTEEVVELKSYDYKLNEENVKLLGRTYAEDGNLWLTYSGSGVEFAFTGTKCDITFLGDNMFADKDHRPRVAIYVNDERVGDYLINDDLDNFGPERTITAFESDTEQSVKVKVVKLSEVCDSTVAISKVSLTGSSDAAAPVATPAKDLKIEFIGDSITCGYGVDGVFNVDPYLTSNEDCTKAYAIKTAELLGADYSLVSMSGHGIISGWTGDPAKPSKNQLVPDFYLSYGNCYGGNINGTKPSKIEWDFSRFQPDVVVINLGTNDSSYCKDGGDMTGEEKKAEFEAQYVEFLKVIREKNPNALICCTLGIMGQDLCPNVENAAAAYTEATGDHNITTYKFAMQNQAVDGVVVDWHPSDATHTKASQALAEYLQVFLTDEN